MNAEIIYVLGKWKDLEGYEEKYFIPYDGPYDNSSEDKQVLLDLKVVLGDEDLDIIELRSAGKITIDMSEVEEIIDMSEVKEKEEKDDG